MRTFRLSNETGRMLTHKQVCSPFRGSRNEGGKSFDPTPSRFFLLSSLLVRLLFAPREKGERKRERRKRKKPSSSLRWNRLVNCRLSLTARKMRFFSPSPALSLSGDPRGDRRSAVVKSEAENNDLDFFISTFFSSYRGLLRIFQSRDTMTMPKKRFIS